MRNQPKTPQFTCGNPLLDAATAELAAFLEAVGELNRLKDWLARNAEELQPTRWTKQLEAAVGDEEKREALRVVHGEKSLSLANIHLLEAVTRAAVWDRHTALAATKDTLVAEHEALKGTHIRQHECSLIRSAVVAINGALRDADLTLPTHTRSLEDRGRKELLQAAAVVRDYAKQRPYWTDELVVPGRKYQHWLNPDVDLRNAFPVDMRDKDGRWPKAAALYEALKAFEKALRELRDASSELRSANGSVNESQHAQRLVAQLYGEGCGGLNQKMVDEQNGRRLEYSTKRARFAVLVERFYTMRVEVTGALVAAIEEAEAHGAFNNAPRMASSSEVIELELRALANIVAADEMLRDYGRELKEHQKTAAEDYSSGAAAQATNEEFKRIAEFSRSRSDKKAKA